MEIKRIAIFDFNADDCAHTAAAVKQHWPDADIEAYTQMPPFAYAFKDARDERKPFDMVFIGIDAMLGVEVARNIRELDGDCPMIIVSGVGDYGMEGFRLHALDYLTKPVSPERIAQAAQRVEARP